MRMLILWAGITAFVWITLHPPIVEGHPVGPRASQWVETYTDTPRLIGRLAVVVVLTGGLLWTEAQVGPWFRRRARVTPGRTP